MSGLNVGGFHQKTLDSTKKRWIPPYAKTPFSFVVTLAELSFTSNTGMKPLGEIYAPR